MRYKTGVLILLITYLSLATSPGPLTSVAIAQESANAWTRNGLNMRIGPSLGHDIIVVLPPGTGLIFEGRTPDGLWLLGHTENRIFRGWVAGSYLLFSGGFVVNDLPITNETIQDLTAPANSAPAMAVVSSWARDILPVRQGPSAAYPVLHEIAATTGIVLEGRSSDGQWVLGHTSGGSVRGWIASRSLYFRQDINLVLLPVLGETMPAPAIAPTPVPPVQQPAPAVAAAPQAAPVASSANAQVSYQGNNKNYNHARVSKINLGAYPIVPTSLGQAHAIYLRGQSQGVNSHVVAKVGDCASALHFFLSPFGHGQYNLGSYGSLQGAIGHFSESLAYGSLAASPGFVAGAVLDATWADPSMCQPGESPLQCEYRVHRPAVAVIMFGTQDVFLMAPEQFDSHMRRIVYETIQAGVIPILSTFPSHLAHWDNTVLYNQIVVQIALDYNIPLVNLWLALEALPNHGLQDDGNHLTNPITTAGDLTEPNLQTGFAMRNLVTLQALDVVLHNAMY